jgi:hypothetical protein
VQPRVQGQASTTGGISQAARETGVSRQQLQRDIAIASIPEEVRDEARAAGVTTQAALLKVAAAAPSKQVEVLAGITKAKAEKTKRKVKAPKAAPKARKAANVTTPAKAEGILLDGDEEIDLDKLFYDRDAPLRDKIAAAVKFCLPTSEWKAALDAIGIADPNAKSPDLDAVWIASSDDKRIAFLDSIQIDPDHRPWHYRPHILALADESEESEPVEAADDLVPELDRTAPWKTPLPDEPEDGMSPGKLDVAAMLKPLLATFDDTPKARADRRRAARAA